MPAKSKAQQRLMAAAEHGASFPAAKKIRRTMTREQMHDFARGSMQGKPAHVNAYGKRARGGK
jgi:GTP-dependent phosphoenolpyruvate carboxykinase